MKSRLFPILTVILAFAGIVRAAEKNTFVLVHGATAGAWEWKKTGKFLSDDGNEVYRATLTGLGERMHLNSPDIDLQTHINDVVNLILFEDLHDIVLTGHSYGGMVITGVMDRVPERIRHVVFLDAAVPDDGMSIWDLFGGAGPQDPSRFKDGFMQVPWVTPDTKPPHNVKQSIKCFSQPVSYKNPAAKTLDVTYVAFVPKDKSAEERAKTDKSWQRAVSRGWTIRTFPGGHVAQQEDPRGVATLIEESVGDKNETVPAASPRPAPLQSPEVHPDGKVSFRFQAPDARKVELSGQFLKDRQPMEKNEAGLWTLTVGPVDPNLYPYNFVVDGTSVSDPSNPDVFPNERFKPSLVDVPANPPLLHAVRDVPHGELTTCYYQSKTLNRTRPLIVYTPPNYRAGTDNYPVLYLVSGTTDTEETWSKAGRVNVILDNLIAEHRAVPMIVTMPYGNMMGETPMPSSPQSGEMYLVFSDELTGNVLPYVEANYRVRVDREGRAIAGFSRGGGQSLFTAFRNPDKFAWIASYAAYLTPEVCERYLPDLAASKPSLLWLGVGKDDFLYQPTITFESYLKERKVDHRSLITEGGHTWMNARQYLGETLQLFFK
ncbi:alpha/beta fold hydrolase [Haloferula sp. BvORR071]|uniref:alpha/beta fold hydrolase n=1 Tax=Haloferula sp. BvORR071 TaxID=1396141 RepID=UPI0009DCD3EC|nr:alpha/beta fold hydrolase [Haloferula sp. BvORR071]